MEKNQIPYDTQNNEKNIKAILKELSIMNIIENKNNNNKLMNLNFEENVKYEEFFFDNYNKWIILNFDLNIIDNKIILEEINKIKIYKEFDIRIYKIMLHMEIYLCIKIEHCILSIVKNTKNDLIRKYKLKEINESYHILIQLLLFILKLYKENIYDFEKILLFVNVLVIFINKCNIMNDKYIKLKNIIFFELLYEKFLVNFYMTINSKQNNNKSDLTSYFKYIIKLFQTKEFNSNINISIMSKKNIIKNFISIILDNFDYINNLEIYEQNEEALINCLANIYKNNINESNFFDTLINNNKESFINLINFETKKNEINKDIYKQNFYIELLNKIFLLESKEKKFLPPENSFIFNGNNSKLSFLLKDFKLNQSIIFFSFQLKNSNSNEIYPLISFTADNKKDILFKLFIQKEDNTNKLYICQEKKKEKIKNLIHLSKIENIYPNINYFLAIKFSNKKLNIYINTKSIKNELYFEEREIFAIGNNSPIMLIGFDDSINNYFSGYIGPIIIINNLSVKNKIDKKNIINKILDSQNLYKYFPLFFCKSSLYNFDNYFCYSSFDEEKQINNLIKYLKDNIEKFECIFYLTPEILDIFHSLKLKNDSNIINLPEIPNVTNGQKNYIIKKMNISLTKINHIFIEFIRNNGLDYLSLVYEYINLLLKSISDNKSEFKKFINKDKFEELIFKSINAIISILYNYIYHEYIVKYTKKYKTLFRNLYDILKCLNKISSNIFIQISQEIFKLFFNFKIMLIEVQNELERQPDSEKLIKEEKLISSFINGYMDMIYDQELYLNIQEGNYLNILFKLSIDIIKNYIHNTNVNKKFPFDSNFFYKLLNLVKFFEKFFTSDYQKQNTTVAIFYNLIEIFLISIDDKNLRQKHFRELIYFVVKNYEKNLIISINFFNFIYEMLWKKLYLVPEDFEYLFSYFNNVNEEDKNNIELIEDLKMIIIKIIIKFAFTENSKEIIDKINSHLELLKDSDIIISNAILEINKIIEFYLLKKKLKNSKITFRMKLFGNIFFFIINLFKLIIKKYETIIDDHKNKNTIEKDEHFNKLLNLLNNIIIILKNKLKEKQKDLNNIYCLIYVLKFYHYIIYNEKNIIQISENKFVENLLQIIELSKEYSFINYNQLFEVKIKDNKYQKTIIEIIFDIYIQYFYNDNNSSECYEKLLNNFNLIFYDVEYFDKKHSIYFINDNLNYYICNKKPKFKDGDINKKYDDLIYFNKIFESKDKFQDNFTTYFLLLIFTIQNKINGKQKYINCPIGKLNNFLNELISSILEEHELLYKMDKTFFFKSSSSNCYNELINIIKEKYIKKKNSIKDIKKLYESILEKNKKDKDNIFNYLNKDDVELNMNEEKNNINISPNIKNNNNIFDIKEENQNEIKNNYGFMLEFPKTKIKFFYELDKNYLINIKKEIMNSIFSLYYLDEFFYSSDFCIVKKYYMNNFINNTQYIDSKKLNYPSVIKNYRNNFEPPLFIKKYNNFIVDPYFPITHSYIKEESLKNKLSMQKSIKIDKKELYNCEYNEEIECEIIKNENAYYGKIYYNDSNNYILFKEQAHNFLNEEGYKHIFLLSYMYDNDDIKSQNSRFSRKKQNKDLLILFEDIDEIIEIRILLLWKGFEIYLKNGKSYIFNFLTTVEYENFMKNFIFKSYLKDLVRKKSFLTDKNIISKFWVKGLISNFEYLLLLNRYSSRSYNDPSQYPIFPWLLKHFKDNENFSNNEKLFLKAMNEYKKIKELDEDNIKIKENSKDKKKITIMKKSLKNKKLYRELKSKEMQIFKKTYKEMNYNEYFKKVNSKIKKLLRDFRYPISFQKNDNREIAKEKFTDELMNNTKFPVHSRCHYSNLGYIYYFLMRQQPYDNLLVKTQGYSLENCNRCFISFDNLQRAVNNGNDNRELIPDLFSKIECFLNLNCDFYGILDFNHNILDDCTQDLDTIDSSNSYLSNFVNLILQTKKVINNKIIGLYLNEWIDIIFGYKQLPEENKRLNSYNIFAKLTYEQNAKLEEKLSKKLKKENLTEKQIKNKLNFKINHILNFGVCPVQLFSEPHKKLKIGIIKENKNDSNLTKYKKSDEDSIEGFLHDNIKLKDARRTIQGKAIIFQINPIINKIFVYTEEDNLLIYDTQIFNEIKDKYFDILTFNILEKINLCYSEDSSLYQIKYSFCSFEENINYELNNENEYHTYYYNKLNYILYNEEIKTDTTKYKFKFIKIITCRHLDFSFKIHYIEMPNKTKKEKTTKSFSFFCEDFVTSCCCISNISFIIGLKNGKLIYYKIENPLKNDTKNTIESVESIKLKEERYIQGHHGSINFIEMNKRLGVIITAGDDNFIFIKKIYDFELLLPIKIDIKYKILMVKISDFNFIYVLCLNKITKKKIIFGYTLSGMKFAKSKYGEFDSFNFTEDGNLITFNGEEYIIILSGSNLKKLNNINEPKNINSKEEIKTSNWFQYNYFMRLGDDNLTKIITFLYTNNQKNYIRVLDTSDF